MVSFVMERDAPHVVMVPSSSSGHAIPFLQFARRLAAEGVVTTVVTTDRHVRELEKTVRSTDLTPQGEPLRILGLRDKKVEISHDEWRRQVREVPEEKLEVMRLLREAVTDVGSPQSWKLRGVAPASPPVCILHDMFVPWAQEAAEKLQIESHLLYVSAAAALSVDLESNRLFDEGRLPITRERRDMVFPDIPGLSPIQALDFAVPYLMPAMYEWMRKYYSRFRRTDVILVNTFYDMEKPVLDALRNQVIGSPDMQAKCILEIGPLLPESHVNEDTVEVEVEERDPCILWLDRQAPNSVLYISFGSFATLEAPQLLELAMGLEASDCSFLWIVRSPNAHGMSAASGSPEPVTEFLPLGFEERMKGRGMCYSGWAPQTRILKHPAVGGFLSHCGWNSTLETVCTGVPMLAWPITAEQHLNRRFLVDTVKVAIELKGNSYTKEELEGDVVRPARFIPKEEIEKKVRILMQDAEGESVRQNMQNLREKSREAGAPDGSSRRNFEAYVNLLHKKIH
ncbi:hypothetical protein KC19_9G120000 [Ceratodon purpureus]|uniref:Glycosyltransferase n=1 Tax=Ceratodon purpureus TaxID=3225 RepID=A0A8T0GR58_CERPU|nr:hypothetical protein KC19_9G120000 [Ceratodon purpureus]